MSLTVSLYIMALVVLNIGGCWWLLAKTKNLKELFEDLDR